MLAMNEVTKYFILGFSALIPLINPPGSAFELLSIVGVADVKPYKTLAKKISINTFLFLAVAGLAGPYVLGFFGISIEILQLMGGSVLVAMGWMMLNKQEDKRDSNDPGIRQAAEICAANYWGSRAFYPLTFPITVGPGSLAVMLTLSGAAKGLALTDRLFAFAGLFLSLVLMSILVYLFYAYAPDAAKWVPAGAVQGVMRIVAFLLLCIGGEIAWHGLQSLLKSMHS
jgi:multiple antibiotic resistance protein